MSLIIQSPEKQRLNLFENLSLHNAFLIDSVFNHFIDSMHYALVVTDSEWVVSKLDQFPLCFPDRNAY